MNILIIKSYDKVTKGKVFEALLGCTFILLLSSQNALAQYHKNTNNTAISNVNALTKNITNTNLTGSVSILPTMIKALRDHVHIPLSKAITIAENHIGKNSSASVGMRDVETGFLLYIVFVADSHNALHRVIVDAGDGRVLSTQQVSDIDLTMLPSDMTRSSTGQSPIMTRSPVRGANGSTGTTNGDDLSR